MKPGRAILKLAPGRWTDPGKLETAVINAGLQLKPGSIRLTAVGTLEHSGTETWLRLSGMKSPTLLLLHSGASSRSKRLVAQVRESARRRLAVVEVEGTWQS